MRRGALVLLALVQGCFGAREYACTDAAQCIVGGVQGTCEGAGFCAFPDDACDSGRRFSPFAGDGLARECVDAVGTTTDVGSTGMMTTTTTTTSDATSAAESSSGCTTDCEQPDWRWTLRDAELGAGRAHGLAHQGSRVIVTGEREVDVDRTETFAAIHDATTGDRDAPISIAPDDDASGVGTAIAATTDAFVVVGHEASTAGLRAFIARFDADTLAWIHRHDTLLDDEYRGVGLAADGRAIAAGRSGVDAIVHAFDEAGDTVFARTISPTAPVSSATLHAIAVAPGGTSWIAGALATGRQTSDPWARRLQADGGTAFEFIDDDPASTPDVARAIAGLADGGLVIGGVVANEGWLARVAAETSQTARVLDDGDVLGLALAPDGSIVAAGWTAGTGRDVWVAGFSAALDPTPIWEVTLDHAGLDDEAHAVAVADDGTVYVAGFASDAGGAAPWLGAYRP